MVSLRSGQSRSLHSSHVPESENVMLIKQTQMLKKLSVFKPGSMGPTANAAGKGKESVL